MVPFPSIWTPNPSPLPVPSRISRPPCYIFQKKKKRKEVLHCDKQMLVWSLSHLNPAWRRALHCPAQGVIGCSRQKADLKKHFEIKAICTWKKPITQTKPRNPLCVCAEYFCRANPALCHMKAECQVFPEFIHKELLSYLKCTTPVLISSSKSLSFAGNRVTWLSEQCWVSETRHSE